MSRSASRSRRRLRRSSRLVTALLAPVALVLPTTAAASATPPYRPPVDVAPSQGFRLGPNPYGAGNRGLDYATAPGTPVRAIGRGVVVFAGQVAGQLYVTVLHPDGLRSSYSYLRTISVRAGVTVGRGDVIGTSGAHLQLGVRRGTTYIDPAPLLGRSGRAHLVLGTAPGRPPS